MNYRLIAEARVAQDLLAARRFYEQQRFILLATQKSGTHCSERRNLSSTNAALS